MDRNTKTELEATVRDYFTKAAPEFAETRATVTDSWAPIRAIVAAVPAGASVLDVGCGSGRLLSLLGGRFVRYLGVDPSEAMLDAARTRYPGERFTAGDITRLGEIPERNFDHVFAVAVLHHLPGKDARLAALKQLKNKIGPDGRIVLTAWNFWQDRRRLRLLARFTALKLIGKNRMDWGDVLLDRKADASVRRYYHAFTKRELRALVRAAGLKTVRLTRDRQNYYAVLTA